MENLAGATEIHEGELVLEDEQDLNGFIGDGGCLVSHVDNSPTGYNGGAEISE